MTILVQYGWTTVHEDHYNMHSGDKLAAGRVISVRGFKYFLITERGELEAEVSGRLLYANDPEEIPRVGDWVLFADYDSIGYITHVLARANALSRREAGTESAKQVLACNIDYAMIVQGLDRDFNVMRLDRYIVQTIACGIRPLVVLNKADLVNNPDEFIRQVEALERECPIHVCSTVTGGGIEEMKLQVLQECRTYAVIGSSGAGKSSLVNALMSADLQRTGSVSDFNNKGKHTTSTRDLFRLPNGSLIIDTPGMREFGIAFESSDHSGDLFPAIDKLSAECRFNDCSHLSESGCAVLAAVASGDLDEMIYNSYVKLMKEQRRFQLSAIEKKRINRQWGKMVKEVKEFKKRLKG